MHYRLNEPDVIQETVEGEALIVHTRSGTYYNLEGCGTLVWNALLSGRSVEQIETTFASRSAAERAEIRSGLETFVRALAAEELILPRERPAEDLAPATEPKTTFTTPGLRKFTDMQELLLVDPIHDVQPEAGWPLPKDPPPRG
jgi:hypothetical protein